MIISAGRYMVYITVLISAEKALNALCIGFIVHLISMVMKKIILVFSLFAMALLTGPVLANAGKFININFGTGVYTGTGNQPSYGDQWNNINSTGSWSAGLNNSSGNNTAIQFMATAATSGGIAGGLNGGFESSSNANLMHSYRYSLTGATMVFKGLTAGQVYRLDFYLQGDAVTAGRRLTIGTDRDTMTVNAGADPNISTFVTM